MNQSGRLMPAANPRHMVLSLSGLSSHYDQNQYFAQSNNRFQSSFPSNYIDIGEYEPPSLAKPDKLWDAPKDIDSTYQRGSTSIRQENNESIDEYYDRLMRKPSEFTQPTPTGAPTVLYQNLQESKSLDSSFDKATTKESSSKKKHSKSRSTTKQNTENKSQEEKPKSTNNKSTTEITKTNQANETSQQSNQVTTTTTTTTTSTANNQQINNQSQTNIPAKNVNAIPQNIQQTQIPAQINAKPIQQTFQQKQAPINNQQRVQTNTITNQSTGGYATQAIQRQSQPTGGHAFQAVQNQARQGEHKPVGGIPPTAKLPKINQANPVVFFDIEIDDEKRGTLVMELFRHALPKTSQNFLSLTLGDRGFGYKHSYLHRIIPGFMAQGGDFEKSDGTGGYSIYGPTFNDEGFPFRHDRAGLLSMANSGPNTNGSQFFITFGPAPHLDGKHTVFGQVLQGYHLLDDFRLSGSESGEPIRAVKIANCGQLQ